MQNSFYGLPVHPLMVHATVVIVPMAALVVLLASVSKRFRTWAGVVPMLLSLIGLILVPLSTSTGETLEKHVAPSALLEKHTQLADGLLPWMIALLVIAVVIYGIQRWVASGHSIGRAIMVGVAVLAIAGTAGTTVQVARIGHSGAKAAWADTNMNSPTPR